MNEPEVTLDEAIAALRELVEASEEVAMYPEGSVGMEDLREAETKAKAVLARFAKAASSQPEETS